MSFFKDLSLTALSAGFVAVLVGFTSSVAIVFQAALAFGASPDVITSWLWALCLGMGLCTALPALWLKKPVMVAWSTPGAAVLATSVGFSMSEAVGAFMVCAALIALVGLSGWFEALMQRIPSAIAAALLAGVLARFGLQAFMAAQSALLLLLLMLGVYLLAKRLYPRYAVILSLLASIAYVALNHQINVTGLNFAFATPIWTSPSFTWQAIVGLALPLFVVTMCAQNLPGVVAIRNFGYGATTDGGGGIPISKIITLTGVATFILAPFGAFALNLSAITAAICMSPSAHEDPNKRYTAAVTCGLIYLAMAVLSAAVVGLLTVFPKELIAIIAGLALLGTIGNSLADALQSETHREAALITFLVTLSGLTLGGIGSAFWGVLAGLLALLLHKESP